MCLFVYNIYDSVCVCVCVCVCVRVCVYVVFDWGKANCVYCPPQSTHTHTHTHSSTKLPTFNICHPPRPCMPSKTPHNYKHAAMHIYTSCGRPFALNWILRSFVSSCNDSLCVRVSCGRSLKTSNLSTNTCTYWVMTSYELHIHHHYCGLSVISLVTQSWG